ncbi:MAG: hypothetical protein M3Y30_12860 [Gemmatimonadota bacterium]|nr:hypothetical protein [Gemmatimonadota bacterium]
MTALSQPALSLAGFALAHAAWSMSDLDDGDHLCPLALVEQHDGARRMTRFEADTQESAIIAGKVAMRNATTVAAAWAFAREGAWGKMRGDASVDVLALDFWGSGMAAAATLIQPFYRATNGGRFRIGSAPSLLVGENVLAPDVATPSLVTIMAGVHSHAMVTTLWSTWR